MTDTHDPRSLTREGDLEIAYPEHAKEDAKRAEIDAIVEFLNWLTAKERLYLCRELQREPNHWGEYPPDYRPITRDPWCPEFQKLAFRWAGVDYDAFFAEKDKMLAFIRECYAKQEESK